MDDPIRPVCLTKHEPILDGCGRVLLMEGKGFVSNIIMWQTWGRPLRPYSHAALLYPDGKTLIESWQGAGVRKKEISDWKGVSIFSVHGSTPAQWARAFAAAERQLGKEYDWLGILRFLSRHKGRVDKRWFCSELAFWALEEGGMRILERVEPWQVAPAAMALSPLLTKKFHAVP